MNELSNCPFCGCSIQIRINGDKLIEPNGWHKEVYPSGNVIWYSHLMYMSIRWLDGRKSC